MFDFGFWEIAIIAVITLIVVGPERMPSLARKAGVYAGKLNKFVKKIKYDIDEQIKVDELKDQLSFEDEKSTLSETLDDVKASSEDSKQEIIKASETKPQPKEELEDEVENIDFTREEQIKSGPQKKK
jgi:sec-independent protein translocase protein TatB